MITIIPYRPEWPHEFALIGHTLREALGDLAVRINHIGSTSVPALAAEDIIDIQITVQDLDPAVQRALKRVGYDRLDGIRKDHVPPGQPDAGTEWTKWMFKSAAGQRSANIHARLAGRLNQRYPLLFRDYLRAHPPTAEAYAQVQIALARQHSEDVDACYDVKDPLCDIIMGGAEDWAAGTHWEQGPADC